MWLQTHSGELQLWQTPSVWHGVFMSKRAALMGEAVDLTNDPELVKVLTEAVGNVEGMTARQDPMNFGGSEDATILARRVQAHGGKAAFFVLGADRPSGHHTAKFDGTRGSPSGRTPSS